jgi:hypothetical protein
MFPAEIAILIVCAILSYALRPRPQTTPPDTLSDVSVPTIQIGKPGRRRIRDCVGR